MAGREFGHCEGPVLAQLHYASAPSGSEDPGPRFTAVGAEVEPGVLREAERLLGYEPPPDSPQQADAEQLKRFPTVFGFSELADGGRMLSRSVCTGTDWAGGPVSFHTHAVLLPAGTRLPDGVLPISTWESPRWAESTPPDGGPGPVDRVEPSGLLRKEALVPFAVSRADRLAAFFADLRAVAADPGAGQIVVVEHDSADVARWVALACTVLPREQAHRLTFTTYTRDPREARQQLVGALPSSEPVADDERYRVHNCTGRQPSGPVADTWAEVCARVWRAGRPDLFHNDPEDLGPLAVSALVEGIELRTDARAAAASWAAGRVDVLPDDTLNALVAGLCGGPVPHLGSPSETLPGAAEQIALAALLARLDGRVTAAVSAPLAARVLASAVLAHGPVPALRAGSLTARAHDDLARDLAPSLRAGIADRAEPAAGRPLALLRAADLLDVDCQDELPELAGRLARELVDASAESPPGVASGAVGCPPALLDAVHTHPGLRVALFGSLDALAAAEPAPVARVLEGSGLPLDLQQSGFPHLRMCVAPAETDDRLDRFRGLLRTAGVSPLADPAVLRTALRLTWPGGELPTGQQAGLLLKELGSDTHRAAGTRELLIEAALAAPPDDPGTPALATDLLRCFTTELGPGRRTALVLLEFTGLLSTESEGEEWVGRVLDLTSAGAADPVPDPVAERAFRTVAWRLLEGPAPENELYTLARSAEPRLLAAYERAARSEQVGERLRSEPAYVADRFCDWTAFPGTYPAWDETRTALLAKVLRPAVRALSGPDQGAVETALDRAARGKLDAFRAWNRPGALGRLAGKLAGRGRRAG
ncbi:GTPase-associated protein 1-related protein [Streptomyces sp. N50]|uniref:GTPase-associated protein 1-related protein n=1 Tax=Streptomyces sp. N50 TaxID=3081765 RepID=UPI002962438A|nr:GTPase-associated protein 1-related protein [Streptomyces sp. N50]WOX13395.1 GTPase-associated protein 1-related protein [Streptomyces sp. N50]